MTEIVELKEFGKFWQIVCDGEVIACAIDRQGAINVAARLLRQRIADPASAAQMQFIGVELAELLTAPSLDWSWKRKCPQIDVELFRKAEGYLQTGFVPANEEALLAEYRGVLQAENFDRALECLVQLGEQQACTNPFWRVLEQLTDTVWPTEWIMDRRAKGQREARIAAIKRRARGRA